MDYLESYLDKMSKQFKKVSGNYYYHYVKHNKIKRKHLGKHDIPLGFTDRNGYGELIKLRYDGKPKCVLISGSKRGCGKSIRSNCEIYVQDNKFNKTRITKIGELAQTNVDGMRALSFNESSGTLEWLPIIRAEQTGVGELFKLTTWTGRETETTSNHRYLTLNDDGFCWKELKDLHLKDKIAVPRVINFDGNSFSEDEAKLLGYLIGDGCTTNYTCFTSGRMSMLLDFQGAARRLFPKQKFNIIKYKGRNASYISCASIDFKNWLQTYGLFGKTSHTKTVPVSIKTADKKTIAIFLNALYSCDGNLYTSHIGTKHKSTVEYCSVNRNLVKGIQELLLCFGIISSIWKKTITYKGKPHFSWNLLISSVDNCRIFMEHIGIDRNSASEFIDFIKNRKSNPNKDTLPISVWKLVKEEAKRKNKTQKQIALALGYSLHKHSIKENRTCMTAVLTTTYAPSHTKIQKIAEYLDSDILKAVSSKDVFWDEITSIKSTNKTEPVFDLQIEGNHNFVADNIIIHNSRLMETIGMDGLCQRMGVKTLFIDPKHELRSHTQPHTHMQHLFDRIGLQAKGVDDLTIVTPSSLKRDGFDDGSFEYALDSSNLNIDDLNTILDINDSGGNAARSQLQLMLYGVDIENEDWEAIKNKKLPSINDLIKSTLDMSSRGAMDSRLLRALMNARSRGSLQPNKFLSIKDLIAKGKNVIMQTSLKSDDTDMDTSAYIAHAIRSIADDRARFVDSNGKIGSIKSPVQIYIEEFNIPFPRKKNPSSKDIIKKIYDQYRFAGVSITAACPSFADIDPTAIKQSDYIFAFKTVDPKERELLYKRVGRSQENMRILEHLDYHPTRHPRGQCAMISPNGDITTFYPLQPLSMPQYEQSTFGSFSEGFE